MSVYRGLFLLATRGESNLREFCTLASYENMSHVETLAQHFNMQLFIELASPNGHAFVCGHCLSIQIRWFQSDGRDSHPALFPGGVFASRHQATNHCREYKSMALFVIDVCFSLSRDVYDMQPVVIGTDCNLYQKWAHDAHENLFLLS